MNNTSKIKKRSTSRAQVIYLAQEIYLRLLVDKYTTDEYTDDGVVERALELSEVFWETMATLKGSK